MVSVVCCYCALTTARIVGNSWVRHSVPGNCCLPCEGVTPWKAIVYRIHTAICRGLVTGQPLGTSFHPSGMGGMGSMGGMCGGMGSDRVSS